MVLLMVGHSREVQLKSCIFEENKNIYSYVVKSQSITSIIHIKLFVILSDHRFKHERNFHKLSTIRHD